MSYNTPQETAEAAVEAGVAKAHLSPAKAVVGGILAGAYIGFGALLAIVASAGLRTETWGGLITLVTGLTFSLGLILVIVGGAELLTGNMMLVPMGVLRRRVSIGRLAANWGLLVVGNLVGALLVAFFLAHATGVIGTATSEAGTTAASTFTRLTALTVPKALTESDYQIFLRAIGCNWLVCLGVWLSLAARTVGGKIIGIVAPITAFVALGFDHVVANMFFLPLALFSDVPGVTIGSTLDNLLWAFLGNGVGAAVFVAGAYWFLYLRATPDATTAPAASTTPARRATGR